jgi:hypothetical protein
VSRAWLYSLKVCHVLGHIAWVSLISLAQNGTRVPYTIPYEGEWCPGRVRGQGERACCLDWFHIQLIALSMKNAAYPQHCISPEQALCLMLLCWLYISLLCLLWEFCFWAGALTALCSSSVYATWMLGHVLCISLKRLRCTGALSSHHSNVLASWLMIHWSLMHLCMGASCSVHFCQCTQHSIYQSTAHSIYRSTQYI